jgi:Glycosyltransferase family 87
VTSSRDRAAVLGLLTVVVIGTALVLFEGFDIASFERALAVGLACAALAAIVLVPSLRAALTMRMVLVASLLLMTIAVVQPPQESHDLWSYAMNGRILEHYGDSPYTHTPADYRHDPLLAQVGSGWRHTRSLYGPVFTAVSAGIMSVAGTDFLATRLGFQLLAALCVLAVLILLIRTTRDPVVALLVGCNPVVVIEVVNVGRNDAIVGLALLGGVLLATRRRFVAAVIVLALAALVKIAVVAVLGAVLLRMWRQHGFRLAARAAAVAAVVMAVPYAVAGGLSALRPVANASNRMSRASIWQLTRHGGPRTCSGSTTRSASAW